MKLFKKLSVFFLFIFSLLANAQNMQEGFTNLEKGEFDKAEVFFTTILKDYPNNKTARLCYARAVGLNKQPEKALMLFTTLRTEYPDDLEIKLNYAESLLWNKNYTDAKVFYSTLVAENPTNFVAHLGYANTLSNLKEFKDALLGIKMLPSTSRNGVYLSYIYYKKLFNKIKNLSAEKIMTERIRIPNHHKIGLMKQ